MSRNALLTVRGLRVVYPTHGKKTFAAVQDVSFHVRQGESIGIVGESGSGKSTVARSMLGLLQGGVGPIEKGEIELDGIRIDRRDLPSLRGSKFAMVFQDPLSYLNPLLSVGKQIAESVKRHDPSSKMRKRIDELLMLVQLPAACFNSYPHELSGGMRQRVLLAIALGCRPRLLIADEPTTALDVTTQKEILTLLKNVRKELGMAMILISHDLAVVSEMCDRVYVMHRGRVIESGISSDVFDMPAHPYTQGLVAASQAVQDESGRFVAVEAIDFDDDELTVCPFSQWKGTGSASVPEGLDETAHFSRRWRAEVV
jgi:ABC-type glutathione transport system ATPase component